MFVNEAKLLENLRNARSNFDNKNYEKAYKHAAIALELDPTNIYANKVIKKTAKFIRKARKVELKRRIKELKPHFIHHHWDFLLKEYIKLDKFYPNYPPILLKINKIKAKIEKSQLKEYKNLRKNTKKEIKQLKKKGEYLNAINTLKNADEYFKGEVWVEKLMRKLKHSYVVHELKKRTQLLNNQEYEKLYRFLTKLYLFFPEKKIKQYIKTTESLIIDKRKYEKQVFIQESLDLINAFYNQGKYEECMQTSDELMEFTGAIKLKAKTFYKKAHKKNEKQMNKMIDAIMKSKNSILEMEFKKNPENFIKI